MVNGKRRFNTASAFRKGEQIMTYFKEHWMCLVGGFAAGYIVGMIL